MDFTNLTANVIILVVTYAFIELYKVVFKTETAKNLIPIVALVIGAVLGGVGYAVIPDYIVATDYVSAVIVGGFSGLSATGSNQIVKQLKKMFDSLRSGE